MKQYIVDAFTDNVFSGNQAAVCVLDNWIPEEMMINIAKENNFSETAFTVQEDGAYRLRWFTPGGEIDLCGHATLATAFVIMQFYEKDRNLIVFHTLSGDLMVERQGDTYEMDLPAFISEKIPVTDQMTEALGERPIEAYLSRDNLLVMDSEDAVKNLKPDMEKLRMLEGLCVGVTAKGREYDCVSRVFAPKLNVTEDPVTGSTHCMIVPIWADKLGKTRVTAYQASARTGTLYCEVKKDRVKMAGKAVVYSIAEILSV